MKKITLNIILFICLINIAFIPVNATDDSQASVYSINIREVNCGIRPVGNGRLRCYATGYLYNPDYCLDLSVVLRERVPGGGWYTIKEWNCNGTGLVEFQEHITMKKNCDYSAMFFYSVRNPNSTQSSPIETLPVRSKIVSN